MGGDLIILVKMVKLKAELQIRSNLKIREKINHFKSFAATKSQQINTACTERAL